MKHIEELHEDILCLIVGLICVAWFIAMAMGDGSIGLLDIF
jgi:hypothetical protein